MASEPRVEEARLYSCNAMFYQAGTVREDVPLDNIDQVLLEPGRLVWLDAERPTETDLALLAREFELHPLAIEDIRKGFQRPKLDQYGDSRLIVMFDARFSPGSQGSRVALHEVDIFIGPNYLITIHDEPVEAIAELKDRWRRHPALVEANPLGFLLYHLLDNLVDGYFPVAEALEEQIEEVEERLFERSDQVVLRDVTALRRDVIQFRRVLEPQREVINLLLRREDRLIDRATVPYFTDVIDLLLRLTTTADSMREMLAVVYETYLSLQSFALNNVLKRLAALTVILFTPTLISGIYGMNFVHMPELGWTFGYPFALGLMVTAALTAALIFRKNGWL
jgi:magnesium transporter